MNLIKISFAVLFLIAGVMVQAQTSNISIRVTPSAQSNSDIIISDGFKESNLLTDVSCVLSNEGNDLVYAITYTGRDFDKDGTNDELTFDLRVRGYIDGTTNYNANAKSSSVTLGTAAPVKNTLFFWGVEGLNESEFNDIDDGQSISFETENIVLTHTGTGNYSHEVGFNSVFINETNGGHSHLIINGVGNNLDSYTSNLDETITYNNQPTTIYLTGAGSFYPETKEWGVQEVNFQITFQNDDDPFYWDLEDYSSYSVAASHVGINYPANWMPEENYPCFSWETVPQHSTFKSGVTLPESTYETVSNYSLVDVNGQDFGMENWDVGMWYANEQLKSYNPTVKGSYYVNSTIVFPWYLHTDEFFEHPEWIGEDSIRGYNTYNHDNAELRQFWVDEFIKGLNHPDVDFGFVDKSVGLPSPFYDENGEIQDGRAQMIDLLYQSMPEGKFLIGNTLRNESDGGNRSAMAAYDGSYLERWTLPHKQYNNQTEAEAYAVSIQLMREALTKGKIIMLRNTDDVYNETGELTNAHFYVPLAGFLMAAEKNGFISYHGSNLHYDPNIWNTTDLDYFTKYLGEPLGPPVKEGLTYSRSFENLDVSLDLSAGTTLEDAVATFTWKGIERPQAIYDYKSQTFEAEITDLSNFTLTENVVNPVRDCSCQGEFVGRLVKDENRSSSLVFDLSPMVITSLEHGVFKFKLYTGSNSLGNIVRMELRNTNDVDPDATELRKTQTIESNAGWVEYTFDFRNETMLSNQYNSIQIFITASGTNTETITYYFDGLRGPKLQEGIITSNTNSSIHGKTHIYPNPTTGIVHLTTSSNYSVANAMGQTLLSNEGNFIDLSSLPNGVYTIQVNELRTKIIKQ